MKTKDWSPTNVFEAVWSELRASPKTEVAKQRTIFDQNTRDY